MHAFVGKRVCLAWRRIGVRLCGIVCIAVKDALNELVFCWEVSDSDRVYCGVNLLCESGKRAVF